MSKRITWDNTEKANHLSSFSPSEHHKQYSLQKAQRVATIFGSQVKAQQEIKDWGDSEQNCQTKKWCTFTDDERYEWQPNEANYVHLNQPQIIMFQHLTKHCMTYQNNMGTFLRGEVSSSARNLRPFS